MGFCVGTLFNTNWSKPLGTCFSNADKGEDTKTYMPSIALHVSYLVIMKGIARKNMVHKKNRPEMNQHNLRIPSIFKYCVKLIGVRETLAAGVRDG